MKIIGLFLALLFSVSLSLGQSLTVFDVDTTNFPLMKAKVFVMDTNGNQLSNLSPNDFTLKENGQLRTVLNVSCPIEKPARQVSVALSIDASLSMFCTAFNPPIERAQKSARKLIELTTSPPSEIALLMCNNYPKILSDFTTNKPKLLSLTTSFNTIDYNNFPEQLLNQNSGLLNIVKSGKYDKSAIMFTNGCGQKLEDSVLKQCIDTCQKYKIKFFAFIYMGWCNKEALINSLRILAETTGGKLYDEIYTDETAINSVYLLRKQIQAGDYCSIEWKSDISCERGLTDLEIELDLLDINSLTKYKSTDNSIAGLSFSPNSVYFKNKLPVKTYDTTITVTAVNSNFNVSEIKSDNSDFSITPTSFNLNVGESIDLKLYFKPQDSCYTFCKFDFINNTCKVNLYASGGFKGVKPKKGTLKLTYPNGAEDFVAGGEKLITWEGISESDNCVLEYSTDNGSTWELITENAVGLSYLWKNIPKTVSNQCLIRIKQNDVNGGYDNKPGIEWAKTYGGAGWDIACSIISTSDGGFVVVGESTSLDLDIPNNGMTDWYIIKLDANGNIIWQQTYGGDRTERPQSIQETKDGSLIVCGFSYSVRGNIKGGDYWILKLDASGNLNWQQTYGGSDWDSAFSIKECKNGGYIVVGESRSNDEDITKQMGHGDWWVLRLNTLGNIIWQNTFGEAMIDWVYQINELSDENFIIVGERLPYIFNSDYTIIGESKIIKIDKNGNLIWEKTFGGSGSDDFRSFVETDDGGFVVGGNTYSLDGDITFNHGGTDFWILKLDPNANIIWQKTFGGESDEFLKFITKVYDGGYICVGSSASTNGDLNENKGLADYWIIKINSTGKLIWQKSLGGSNEDIARSVDRTGDGGFVVAGETMSFDGDVNGFRGLHDYWVIKFSADGITLQEDVSDSVFSIVIPTAESRDVDMGYCAIGYSKDSIITEFIKNIGLYKIRIDSIFFSGDDAKAFSIVPDFSEYELEPGESQPTEFKFSPYKKGKHEALINIITQSDTLVQNISGEGYQPQLDIVSGFINFGEVELGNYKQIQDSTLIKNISDMPVMINSILQNDFGNSQFEIVNSDSSFVLQPNEERKISMKFKPIYGGRTTGQIAFVYNGVGSPVIVGLFGTGIGGNLRIAKDSAYAGESRNLKLIMEKAKPEGIAALAPNFEVTIRYQNTILAPINNPNWTISSDSTYLKVSSKFGTSNDIAQIPVIAGLGNVDETAIDIVDFVLKDDSGNKVDYDFEFESGTFKLLGICYEGGVRLINPNNKVELLQISPNPNDGNLAVGLNLIEDGSSTLSIYNSNGQLMFEQNISGTTGKIDLNIDTKEYGNGLYFVSLQTPTIRKVKQMVVFK